MAVQTNAEVLACLEEMMPGIVEGITKQVTKVLESGAINLADYEGQPYKPVKLILAAVLTGEGPQYMPPHPTKADVKTVKNLKHFL